uniref:Integrase catalytic domain-containing protein n=1 Tax=Scylla olivacea TaxID=85551 RepID=A0A0P4W182_SCYOL
MCALPNHEAETMAQFLVDQVFTRFGVPGELHSHQEHEFESRNFYECCRVLGIHKTRTTPLRPQTDGMMERINVTIVHDLDNKYYSADQHDCDVWVSYMLTAYRSGEHETTGYLSARLMFDRKIHFPATGRPPEGGLPYVHTDCVKTLQRRL